MNKSLVGGTVKKPLQIIVIVVGVLAVLFAAWFVDNFVYPFHADSPSYSDVEKAFAKVQFPSDWTEISSSENRGLHGRGCNPFNDSGCFHKGKTFKVSESTTVENVKAILAQAGCGVVTTQDITYGGETKPRTNVRCNIHANLQFAAEIIGTDSTVYVSAQTY